MLVICGVGNKLLLLHLQAQPQPPAPGPQPRIKIKILSPEPQTPHPKSQTSTLKPQTPNPKPPIHTPTPNPHPQNLNPETPHPKAGLGGPHGRRARAWGQRKGLAWLCSGTRLSRCPARREARPRGTARRSRCRLSLCVSSSLCVYISLFFSVSACLS
jgi:hypothetical protein